MLNCFYCRLEGGHGWLAIEPFLRGIVRFSQYLCKDVLKRVMEMKKKSLKPQGCCLFPCLCKYDLSKPPPTPSASDHVRGAAVSNGVHGVQFTE